LRRGPALKAGYALADIFISYAQKALEPTQTLAADLARLKYTYWFDERLLPIEVFGQVINEQIDEAKAVITIWSEPALKSKWVYAEALRAADQNKLLNLHTPEVKPEWIPVPFAAAHVFPIGNRTEIYEALAKLGVHPGGAAPVDWMARAFERIANSTDIEDFEAFLADFGTEGKQFYIRLARKKIAELLASENRIRQFETSPKSYAHISPDGVGKKEPRKDTHSEIGSKNYRAKNKTQTDAIKADARNLLVFISHADIDKQRIKPIVLKLLDERFSIWIDNPRALGLQNHPLVHRIRSTESWQKSIRNAIDVSDCVLTFWSRASAEDKRTELHEEARIAKSNAKLVQVAIDKLSGFELPLGFSEKQVISLVDEMEKHDATSEIDISDVINDILHLKESKNAKFKDGTQFAGDNIASHSAGTVPSATPIEIINAPADVFWGDDARIHIRTIKSKTIYDAVVRNQTIETLKTTTADLVNMVRAGHAQARKDYADFLERYLEELKKDINILNPITLENQYKTIYYMLQADKGIMAIAFQASLSTWVTTHQGLRTYFSAISEYYMRQQEGCIKQAIPMDAVSAFERIIDEEDQFFDSEVPALINSAPLEAYLNMVQQNPSALDENYAAPIPKDEFTNLSALVARPYWFASTINAIWRACLKPPALLMNAARWRGVLTKLEPHARAVVNWLRKYLEENERG
jgi:hypothetical protein